MCCFAASKPIMPSKTITQKTINLDSYIRPYMNNSKRNKNLNITAKTLTLLRENIGANLHDLVFGDGF